MTVSSHAIHTQGPSFIAFLLSRWLAETPPTPRWGTSESRMSFDFISLLMQ